MGDEQIGSAKHHSMDNAIAERERRNIARLKAKAAAAEGVSNAKIEAELAGLKAENARLRSELASERSRAANPPKAAKPPLPPDEARERRIKALTTQVQNLRAVIQAIVGRASMPRATLNAIAKALHPDRKLSESERETERETALKLFTSWKADKDKVVRKAKG